MQLLKLFYSDKDLVTSSTRFEKNISQVAENITVITGSEIEAMNCHSVAEVLSKVSGIFLIWNQDYISPSLINIQGSTPSQVLVMLDEIPWNYISSGSAEVSLIPVGAIERIEIIKGPASSSWGSSLGGVINIITKKNESNEKSGMVSAAYGSSGSRDLRAGVSGKKGTVGYYLHAGNRASNGLVPTRSFDGWNMFSKLNAPLSSKGSLTLELGYDSTTMGFGEFPEDDLYSGVDTETFYSQGSMDFSLENDAYFNLSIFNCSRYDAMPANTLGLSGVYGEFGTLIKNNRYKEKNAGVKGRIAWKTGNQTVVLGAEYDTGSFKQTTLTGPFLQDYLDVPPASIVASHMKQWAVYANDSVVLDRLSVTPGIRYDHNGNWGAFISPSLGFAYNISDNTIISGSISRGFTTPPLSFTAGGDLFILPNPSLRPEIIRAYQSGMETSFAPWMRTKVTFFKYKVTNIFTPASMGLSPFSLMVINGGDRRREGFELETEVLLHRHVSLSSGYSYIAITPPDAYGSSNMHSVDIKLVYDDEESLQAQLTGQKRFYDVDETLGGEYDDFIWDFNINKSLKNYYRVRPKFFFTAHNIFNGSQYMDYSKKNPDRWIEGGVSLYF